MQISCFILAILPFIWNGRCEAEIAFNERQHHDDEATLKVMKDVNKMCPDITHFYDLPSSYADELADKFEITVPNRTHNGHALHVIAFGKNPEVHKAGIPDFKYVANMHGNEVTGKELLLRLMVRLCEEWLKPDGNGTFKWLIENTRMSFLPSMNPDGWKLANAQDGKKDWLVGRANGKGVDLNRNFPDLNSVEYREERKPNGRNHHLGNLMKEFHDSKLGLEPETMMVMAWLADPNFSWVLSSNMHNGDLVANIPYDSTRDGSEKKYTPSPDEATFEYLAKSYSEPHRKMTNHPPCDKKTNPDDDFAKQDGITNGAAWYSVRGGLQDYNYLAVDCFEVTLELGCEKFPDGNKLPEIWEDNKESLINYMLQTHIGIQGQITNSDGLRDLKVQVAVKDESGKWKYIDHDVGTHQIGDIVQYYRLLVDGQYLVNVAGQSDQNVDICTYPQRVTVKNVPQQKAQRIDFDMTSADEENCYYFDAAKRSGSKYGSKSPSRTELDTRQLLRLLQEEAYYDQFRNNNPYRRGYY